MSKAATVLKAGYKVLRHSASKYSSELSIGIGLGLVTSAIIFACADSPKASKLIEQKKNELGVSELTAKDKIQTTYKSYARTATTAAAGIAFIIGGSVIAGRRAATMAAAYSLADAALRDYKEAMADNLGEEKVKEIQQVIAQKHVEQIDVPQKYVANALTTGGQIYKDPFGVIFVATEADIIRGLAAVNEELGNSPRGFAPYSAFRNAAGLGEFGAYSSYVYDKIGFRNTLRLDADMYTIGAKTNDGHSCLELNFDLKSEYESDYGW